MGYKGDTGRQYKQLGVNQKGDNRVKFTPNEVWKAQQLKAYKRTNGLCFHCGEKYSPEHHCDNQAQLKALDLEEGPMYLSAEVLDAVTSMEDVKQEEMFLSINALADTTTSKTIRLRALVGKHVMLMLLDSGSSHTFINTDMISKLGVQP